MSEESKETDISHLITDEELAFYQTKAKENAHSIKVIESAKNLVNKGHGFTVIYHLDKDKRLVGFTITGSI